MIMAVFRRPVLWNMRIDIYRDKNKTNQAWKEIGEEFGLPGNYMFCEIYLIKKSGLPLIAWLTNSC